MARVGVDSEDAIGRRVCSCGTVEGYGCGALDDAQVFGVGFVEMKTRGPAGFGGKSDENAGFGVGW